MIVELAEPNAYIKDIGGHIKGDIGFFPSQLVFFFDISDAKNYFGKKTRVDFDFKNISFIEGVCHNFLEWNKKK